ncbi:MAG TPA: hypothetical protein VFI73_04530 [Candidatus Nitrosopolaris sp.]|nr:hypothetical protein [Candidatus Nitrosopolaris sp.]
MNKSISFMITHIYELGMIAESLKKSGLCHRLSHYDRTNIAGRVYALLAEKDLGITKKIGPDTYITITPSVVSNCREESK